MTETVTIGDALPVSQYWGWQGIYGSILPDNVDEPKPIGDAPPVGQYWEGQGGIYAGIMADYVGHEPKHLIFSVDEATDVLWGGFAHEEPQARSNWDGEANTRALLSSRRQHPAATWADNYEKDGHTDFHLPSRLELQVASVTIADQFDQNDWYWSSTDRDKAMAYGRNFSGVDMKHLFKSFTGRVRAVRTIPA
ncbi:MAG TPA: hypothetical protein VL598_01900 [Trinickia sp.]|jgi:hypothetical protein|uniref:hypothetical protein n=1 Tax=Trinickia sp. TaxID=2571163 RepID=UPI002C10524B|nr:hypothetical protein [Trinickia sp.]HTI16397.1 hypothetical protein [Trinickia sp.]